MMKAKGLPPPVFETKNKYQSMSDQDQKIENRRKMNAKMMEMPI